MIIAPLDNNQIGIILQTTGNMMVLTQEEYAELVMGLQGQEVEDEEGWAWKRGKRKISQP